MIPESGSEYPDLTVEEPETKAVGIPAILHSMTPALRELGPKRTAQTLRSHDQFNTTIYGLNDRYRGIKKGRDVVFVNPDDLAEMGLADGQRVDVISEWPGEPDRVLPDQRLVSYPTARGCAAAYYPEANVLVSLASVALGSNTPVSKGVIVRLQPR